MHMIRKCTGGIAGDTRPSAVRADLFPGPCPVSPGAILQRGASRGTTLSKSHMADLHRSAQKRGKTLRMGTGRTTRNLHHQAGAARLILASGGSFAQSLKAGQWHPSAYRP